MSNYALEVSNLTKVIRNKTIVDQVSFQVEKGEIFGLLGPNGAGKTTIIRMIVQLINRNGGTVKVNGFDLDHQFEQAISEVGAIVENPEFYKYMSGMKNLEHYERMAATPISKEKLTEVIELVGLEGAIHQKVRTYSLGMRQRLGVAQALLHSPSLLILDEPTNGLDPQGIREFREYLRVLATQGISVLVSSHLLAEMELMCDRFAIIEKGKLIHISSMKEAQTEESLTEQEVNFTVNPVQQAKALLQEAGIVVQSDSFRLKIRVNREGIAKVNRLLVENDIAVYEIQPVKATLEDRFLEITNHEKERTL